MKMFKVSLLLGILSLTIFAFNTQRATPHAMGQIYMGKFDFFSSDTDPGKFIDVKSLSGWICVSTVGCCCEYYRVINQDGSVTFYSCPDASPNLNFAHYQIDKLLFK